jgi:hypothetical protein
MNAKNYARKVVLEKLLLFLATILKSPTYQPYRALSLHSQKEIFQGHTKAAKTLAKEIVNTRRAIDRMHVAKTQLNSVSMQLQTTACELTVHILILLP